MTAASAKKDRTMKLFGTVKSFDTGQGFGPDGVSPLRDSRRHSMNAIYMTVGAVAALSIGTPASAQWGHEQRHSEAPSTPAGNEWSLDGRYIQQLQFQIDAGVSRGTISRRESIGLRAQLNRLRRFEQKFNQDGISRREDAELMRRSAALSDDIRRASRVDNGRGNNTMAWLIGSGNGHEAPQARFSPLHRGDRFTGDVRVGQQASSRMVNMPTEYRGQYVDGGRVYYGYDNGRIYQIDRHSQTILALLDVGGG
jgi:hypothetical protein